MAGNFLAKRISLLPGNGRGKGRLRPSEKRNLSKRMNGGGRGNFTAWIKEHDGRDGLWVG